MSIGIDWCEENYAISPYVAEFWNTLSSLLFCVVGVSILRSSSRLGRARLPLPLRVCGLLVCALGIASAAFHATLSLGWQRADEALENAALAAVWHGASAPRAGASARDVSRFEWRFALHALGAMAGVVALSFALFAEVHVVGSAVGVARALSGAADACEDKTRQWRRGTAEAVGGRLRVALAAAVAGALAWLVDRLACPPRALNPQLHAWWHAAGALALHEAWSAAALAGAALDGGRPRARLALAARGWLSVVTPEERAA
jgi:hypothetical protein